jgi:hypothetical protein
MMKLGNYIMRIVFLGILLNAVLALQGLDLPISQVADDSSLRLSLKEKWLTEAPAAVLRNRTFTATLPSGEPVQVSAEGRANECTVILAREWNGGFPGWGQGSWILTRRLTGEYARLRVFLHSDPNTFIQWRPAEEKDRSLLDVVLYQAYIVRDQPVGIPFEQLLTMSLNDALAVSGKRFPARYFNPDPNRYRDIRALLEKVRAAMPGLSYADDGALDGEGRYVFIRDGSPQNGDGESGGLNCSGFAKWFVDGLLKPLTGSALEIAPLKEPTVKSGSAVSEHYAESREPAFGLDWTRNLAMAYYRAFRSVPMARVEEVEVRDETFAAVIDRRSGAASVRSYPGFLSGAGFSVEGLKPLLYTLAINEPGTVYLASVSREMGPAPVMRRHYHVAVLVPYFNEYGVFQTAVFESAAETSLNGFIGRHPAAMVNLVRLPAEAAFIP